MTEKTPSASSLSLLKGSSSRQNSQKSSTPSSIERNVSEPRLSSASVKDRELYTIFTSFISDDSPKDENDEHMISAEEIKRTLEQEGLHPTRVESSIAFLDQKGKGYLSFEDLRRVKELPDTVLEKALKGRLCIPSFKVLADELQQLYTEVLPHDEGKEYFEIGGIEFPRHHPLPTSFNNRYGSQGSEEKWGVAVCTIDGQCWSTGSLSPFTLQGVANPLIYCMTIENRGEQKVKEHIGHEPSGVGFSAFELNDEKQPHNPLIDSGAIMASSLFMPAGSPAEKFDHAIAVVNDLAGATSKHKAAKVAFDNEAYLSMADNSDHSFALAYFMKSFGAFENKVDIDKSLNFFFQMNSVLTTTEDVAVIAATLANGGMNPVNGKRVFNPNTARNVLSLMYSCGMSDYSGEFAYTVGLPATTGTSGGMMIVVPNLMGIGIWSPKIDRYSNSTRGIKFAHLLVERFNLHIFDTLSGLTGTKKNPRLHSSSDSREDLVTELCYAAANGDLASIKTLLGGGSPNIADYDNRTPLHLAAAEGRDLICEWLLQRGALVNCQDRWGNTPIDEAIRGNHTAVVELFTKFLAEQKEQEEKEMEEIRSQQLQQQQQAQEKRAASLTISLSGGNSSNNVSTPTLVVPGGALRRSPSGQRLVSAVTAPVPTPLVATPLPSITLLPTVGKNKE